MPGQPVIPSLIISRGLPVPLAEGQPAPAGNRGMRYGEQATVPFWPNEYPLADEGSKFIAGMAIGQTALQLGLSAAFSAAGACIVVQNTDSPSNPFPKRTYIRRIHGVVTTVPTSGTAWNWATVIDNVNRTPTTLPVLGGAAATQTAYQAPSNGVNMDDGRQSLTKVYFPFSTAAGAPPVIPAASANVRTLIGNGQFRNVIPVAGDDFRILFGNVDDMPSPYSNVATIAKLAETHPEVILGPGQAFILYMWFPSNVTAGMAFSQLDVTYVER